MRTRGDTTNEPAAESPIHEQSFWGSNTDARQQDWVGYLGLDAPDDKTSVPSERAMTEEPVELTPAPVLPAVDTPDGYAALAAPNDDLLPNR
jgi:hypothetical protein